MDRAEQFLHDHPRLLCWLFASLGTGLSFYELYAVRHETFYSPMAAVFGPFCAIFFFTLGVLPEKAAPDEKRRKILQAVALLGLIAGSINWYAMSHF